MKTLIELYDERPLENVLGTEVFKPERTVFLCPPEVYENKGLQSQLRAFFLKRGIQAKLDFWMTSLLDAGLVKQSLLKVLNTYEDCVLDISGGTDAALFAAGIVCAEKEIPVYTYSRKANRFYEIHNAEFARNKLCEVSYSVEDSLMMAGGAMREGRVDNNCLKNYLDLFDPFFDCYLDFRRDWVRTITFIQQISQCPVAEEIPLQVEGEWYMQQPRGGMIPAPVSVFERLQNIDMISELSFLPEKSVSFCFRDRQIRNWLRDIGSVLELYVYKACLDTGAFHDVRSSVIVDWQNGRRNTGVSNEIDVMGVHGILPVFISCKTCDVKTEALNELAVLRDRFGGQIARAAIVTSAAGGMQMRHRAMELGIDVIGRNDLKKGIIQERLKVLTRPY